MGRRFMSEAADTLRGMKPERLLARLRLGSIGNVPFRDLAALLDALGFELVRRRGSHHIFVHPNVPGILNFQSVRGEAKPYQIRQLLRTIDDHHLRIEGRPQ